MVHITAEVREREEERGEREREGRERGESGSYHS